MYSAGQNIPSHVSYDSMRHRSGSAPVLLRVGDFPL